jgi:uncharacterized membrane protein YphA (DoxX/SURF4 family)
MRITQRLLLIKLTVLSGLFISVLLSLNLWAGQRWFPKVPVIDGFYGLSAPYDFISLAVLFILLFVCFFSRSRKPVWCLLLFCVYLCFEDQNRLQPWFFNYLFILFILQFYKQRVDESNNFTSIFICLQVLVALIYIYSGIQKFNDFFVKDTFSWMIQPLNDVLTAKQMGLLSKFGKLVPYIELLTGIGLLIKPLRFIALPLVIIMHLFILLMLGPVGRSFNYVIWPWNIVMILLCLLLYSNVKQERFFDISFLFKHISFYLVMLVMLILPVFSFSNKYDSYLSSSLYSGNTHGCKLILTDKAFKKLPLYIRAYVVRNSDYNLLYIKQWAMGELNTPCVPEYRVFEKVQERVMLLTRSNREEVKLDFKERQKLFGF